MKLVIDIDEETLQDLYDSRYVSPHIKDVFRSSTPLPKGHGRLIDADALKQVYENTEDAEVCKWTLYGVTSEIDDADTIIEADRESEVAE